MSSRKRKADSLSFDTDDKVSIPEIGQKAILIPSSDKRLNRNLKMKALNKTITKQESTSLDAFNIKGSKMDLKRMMEAEREKFHNAAMNGDVATYTKLVENKENTNPEDEEGFTPLYHAAEKGHFTLCEFIIARVADKNPGKSNGNTPLHIAAQNGHYDICKLIVEKVSNKNPKNDGEFTPLYVAAQNGFLDICKLIIENIEDKNPDHVDGFTPVFIAAQNGYFEICKLIIQNVKDKNPATKNGLTPLHAAAAEGHFKICWLIIESVEDKNPSNPNNGWTPLHYAANKGHTKICELIRSKVENKNPTNFKGETPYALATKLTNKLFKSISVMGLPSTDLKLTKVQIKALPKEGDLFSNTDSTALKTKKKKRSGLGKHLMKELKLSDDLAEFIGKKQATRQECVKAFWAHIKKNELQDPQDKQYFTPDQKMAKLFGDQRIKGFGMAKILSTSAGHVAPIS